MAMPTLADLTDDERTAALNYFRGRAAMLIQGWARRRDRQRKRLRSERYDAATGTYTTSAMHVKQHVKQPAATVNPAFTMTASVAAYEPQVISTGSLNTEY